MTSMLRMLIAALCVGTMVPATAAAQDVEDAPDDSWITVSGTVVSTRPDGFRLDYGDGVMTVEMDDFDSYDESRALLENDQVIVTGMIDDDLYEARTLEASTVYVENLGTHFFASHVDEEDYVTWAVHDPVVVVGRVELIGEVEEIDGRELVVKVGSNEIRVDTIALGYNPLDEEGYVKIEVGDRIKVAGNVDDDVWEAREIMADWLVELSS